MAFDYFARQHVDIAVIEVGLAGGLIHQRHHALVSAHHQHQLRPPGHLGNTLPRNRVRKGGHHQTGRARRDRGTPG
jgi:hypothetical protein